MDYIEALANIWEQSVFRVLRLKPGIFHSKKALNLRLLCGTFYHCINLNRNNHYVTGWHDHVGEIPVEMYTGIGNNYCSLNAR